MIKNGQKGAAPMYVTIIVVLLILVGIYIFFSFKNSSSTSTGTPTTTNSNPFTALDSSSNIQVANNTTPPNQPLIPTASSVTQNAPVIQQPVTYTQPVVQQIQTTPQPLVTAPFINKVVPITNSGYAAPIADVVPVTYTPTIPTYNIPYTTATIPVTNTTTKATTTKVVSSGGGSSDSGSVTSGVVSGLLGCVTGLLVSGPIGCIVFGVLGGLSGAGTFGGAAGGIIGGITSGGLGSITGLLGGGGGIGGMFGGGGGSGNFGGRVTDVTYCTCSISIMLDVDDVRGQSLQLIYMPGVSQLYANYDVYGTGQNVLGTYTQGGECEVYDGESCNSQGSPDGMISLIGTS